MIADVVGAVHNPKPGLMIGNGESTSMYDAAGVSVTYK